jgi:subtilase family serine protease
MTCRQIYGWTLLFGSGLLTQIVSGQDAFPVVPSADPGSMRPFVWMVNSPEIVHGPGQNCGSGNPCYYVPADIQRAYATSLIQNGNGGAGTTIAIVDAFHYAGAEADLNAFSAAFGLPPCTSASGCFQQVSQTGGPPVAGFNQGWAVETNLDLQWAHAMAPNARILLVEGTTNSMTNLNVAVLYAQTHADVVSNSWGTNEFSGETSFDSTYSGSPVPILFGSGDSGAAGHAYPCASSYVLCVGGTTLQETATSFRNIETGWSGGGGGCSPYVTARAYEAPFSNPLCGSSRGMPDIAALADPVSGVLVFLGSGILGSGNQGFAVVGGTSLACPLATGIVAQIQAARLAAGKKEFGFDLASAIYTAAGFAYNYRYYDVTSGNNGQPARGGYDLVTGLGVVLGPALANALVAMP